jgi:hypothetical protein
VWLVRRHAVTAALATRASPSRRRRRQLLRCVRWVRSQCPVRRSAATAAQPLASAVAVVQCRLWGRCAHPASLASVARYHASLVRLATCVASTAQHRPRSCSVRTGTTAPLDPA